MEYKKGNKVTLKDGSGTTQATIVEDGTDGFGRVRVRPEGYPFDISVPTKSEGQAYIIN